MPAAGGDGIGGVALRRVALAHGCSDAALGPDAGGAFTERRSCDDGHRQRREPERREQAGEAGADDDDVAGAQLSGRVPETRNHLESCVEPMSASLA